MGEDLNAGVGVSQGRIMGPGLYPYYKILVFLFFILSLLNELKYLHSFEKNTEFCCPCVICKILITECNLACKPTPERVPKHNFDVFRAILLRCLANRLNDSHSHAIVNVFSKTCNHLPFSFEMFIFDDCHVAKFNMNISHEYVVKNKQNIKIKSI